jgi:hypothetical protein
MSSTLTELGAYSLTDGPSRWSGARRVLGKEDDRSSVGSGPALSIVCSFCGKPRDEVSGIVAGPTPSIAICNECVSLCAEILGDPGTA